MEALFNFVISRLACKDKGLSLDLLMEAICPQLPHLISVTEYELLLGKVLNACTYPTQCSLTVLLVAALLERLPYNPIDNKRQAAA